MKHDESAQRYTHALSVILTDGPLYINFISISICLCVCMATWILVLLFVCLSTFKGVKARLYTHKSMIETSFRQNICVVLLLIIFKFRHTYWKIRIKRKLQTSNKNYQLLVSCSCRIINFVSATADCYCGSTF